MISVSSTSGNDFIETSGVELSTPESGVNSISINSDGIELDDFVKNVSRAKSLNQSLRETMSDKQKTLLSELSLYRDLQNPLDEDLATILYNLILLPKELCGIITSYIRFDNFPASRRKKHSLLFSRVKSSFSQNKKNRVKKSIFCGGTGHIESIYKYGHINCIDHGFRIFDREIQPIGMGMQFHMPHSIKRSLQIRSVSMEGNNFFIVFGFDIIFYLDGRWIHSEKAFKHSYDSKTYKIITVSSDNSGGAQRISIRYIPNRNPTPRVEVEGKDYLNIGSSQIEERGRIPFYRNLPYEDELDAAGIVFVEMTGKIYKIPKPYSRTSVSTNHRKDETREFCMRYKLITGQYVMIDKMYALNGKLELVVYTPDCQRLETISYPPDKGKNYWGGWDYDLISITPFGRIIGINFSNCEIVVIR